MREIDLWLAQAVGQTQPELATLVGDIADGAVVADADCGKRYRFVGIFPL